MMSKEKKRKEKKRKEKKRKEKKRKKHEIRHNNSCLNIEYTEYRSRACPCSYTTFFSPLSVLRISH
jgi:hypothetical protein